MLKTRLKRKLRRFRYYRTISLKRRTMAKILIVLAIIIIAMSVIIIRISPVVLDISVSLINDIMRASANDAIIEVMASGKYDYDDLVSMEKDSEGNITALRTNIMAVNLLQAEVSSAVIENAEELSNTVIKIPLGSVTGVALLSGHGPKIRVKLLAVTNVNSDFSNQFSSAGINQTRHQIMMNIEIKLSIVLPTGTTSITVLEPVIVTETIIVGAVPDSFAEFNKG